MTTDTPIRLVLPWDSVVREDRALLEAILDLRRPPEQLRRLRRRIDLSVQAPRGAAWQSSAEIRRFLRGLRVGVGFFVPLRSTFLTAYAVAQLDSCTIIDSPLLPGIGVRFKTDAMVSVGYRLAQEAMGICALANLTEDEACQHCWELEVELSNRFALD